MAGEKPPENGREKALGSRGWNSRKATVRKSF
jgi:hypothetical protein